MDLVCYVTYKRCFKGGGPKFYKNDGWSRTLWVTSLGKRVLCTNPGELEAQYRYDQVEKCIS